MAEEKELLEILTQYKTVAIVGLSPNPERLSYEVAQYLKEQGYCVIPVNPTAAEIMGEISYPNLRSIPKAVEVVDIFRRSEEAPAIVEDAIAIGAKVIWMQEGVVHESAAARARLAGLKVIMDRCMKRQHQRLIMGKKDSFIEVSHGGS